MIFEDSQLMTLEAKLQNGQPLDARDGMMLYRSTDLHGIAQLAASVREGRHGHRAWIRQDLGASVISTATRGERIAGLLDFSGTHYEPPLEAGVSGQGYLKHVAVARLLLRSVDHIVVRQCPEVENVCQLALAFGADTLIGPEVAELERQERAAGFSPELQT